MRILSGFGGLLIVLAVAAGATLAHLHSNHPNQLTASHQTSTNESVGSLPYPPSRLPHPAALPTPTPAPSKPATAAGSTSTAPKAAAPGSGTHPSPPRLYSVSGQQALINRDRARYGLAPLAWNGCLYAVALANARRMAAAEVMSHANGVYQDLACHIGNRSGENVGYYTLGANDSIINNAFMNSAEHKANILGSYHYVATAWVVGANGYGYIAVEFD
ncbi:MAG TPA: CAP domain-containing protein [Candidatus Dormibacteraeota bacterium]|nr:CAP domain-containing protein [Candidatus Dormibacteraeota bacterium]